MRLNSFKIKYLFGILKADFNNIYLYMANKTLLSLPDRFKIAPEYRGYAVTDLESLLTPKQLAFALAYISTGGNGTASAKIARDQYGGDKGAKVYSKAEKAAEKRNCSNMAHFLIGNTLVNTFIYLKYEELRENASKTAKRSFEEYLVTFEEIRDAAIDAEDYTPALQAHRDIGKLLGHTEEDTNNSRISDAQLIAIIAGTDQRLEKVLNKRMGLTVIEPEQE